MHINIGIAEENRARLALELSKLLADSYMLLLKTQHYHWNVTGPMFQTLHVMLEQQYTELAVATDAIAERIRALGQPAPGSCAEFARLATVTESDSIPKAPRMIRLLVEAHETLMRTARDVLTVATQAGDEGTADFATQRLQVHEKTAWMLRSLLEE